MPMPVIPAGMVTRTGCGWPGAIVFGALPRAAPAIRSNRSDTVRYSRLTAARSMISPVDLMTATTATWLLNACTGSVFGAVTANRLWRSNISVAGPVRAGIVIEMLSAADEAMITSQNWRFVLTPLPRLDAHTAACVVRFTGLRPACPVNPKVVNAIAARPTRQTLRRTCSVLNRHRHTRTDCGHRFGSAPAPMNELEELRACARIVVEHSAHGARDGHGILFLDSAHGHAEMRGFHDDGYAQRFQLAGQRFGDFSSEPLLHLQPPREHVDDAWDLAQSDDFPVRDVRHVALAKERQQVMLAEAVHVDVAHHHHFVVVHGEERAVDDFVDVCLVAAGQKPERLVDTSRRFEEPLARRILAELCQQLPNEFLHQCTP